MRTIALEEHFWTAALAAPPGTGQLAVWGPRVGDQLSDLGPLRLADADELERATVELGFVGALVNSTLGSNGAFLDDARFEPLLDRFERLDTPLYLHPAPPPPALRELLYGGLPPGVAARMATGAWGWHAEAGLHVLRMVATGVFDRHPALRMIVGHCGEMLPFMLARIDVVLRVDDLAMQPSE